MSPPGTPPPTLGAGAKARFVAVGLYNTGFAFCLFAVAHVALPSAHPLVLLGGVQVVIVLNAFVAHRFVVFKVRDRILTDFGRFWIVHLTALGLNACILQILTSMYGVDAIASELVATVVTSVISWFGHSRFSFRR